jgi:hypothetical protein
MIVSVADRDRLDLNDVVLLRDRDLKAGCFRRAPEDARYSLMLETTGKELKTSFYRHS